MAAPYGNQFWKLRSKHGRDKLFSTPDQLWEAASEYFQWCDENPIESQDNKGTKNINTVKFNRPYTIKGLCLYLNTCEAWFKEFKKRDLSDDFITVCRKIEDIIYNQKFEGAAIGIFNPNIIARDLGLADHQKNDNHNTIVISTSEGAKEGLDDMAGDE